MKNFFSIRHTSFFALIFILLLSGCSTSPRYTDDYKPDARFTDYKTYQWRQVSSEVTGVNQQRVQSLIDNQLSRQGLRKVDGAPDLLIDMNLLLQTASSPPTGIGIGIGLPVGRHGSIGLGSGQVLNRSKQVSVIVVDLTDSKTNALVWRGTANNLPVKSLAPENSNQLAKHIESLLNQYPPR